MKQSTISVVLHDKQIINPDYLDIHRHRQIISYNQQGELLYQQICAQFQQYYTLILAPAQTLEPLLKQKPQCHPGLAQFKMFFSQLLDILTQVPSFQMTSLSRMKQFRESQLGCDYDTFLQKIQNFSKQQQTYYNHRLLYTTQTQQLLKKNQQIALQLKKVQNNFNSSIIKKQLDSLKQGMTKKYGFQELIQQDLHQMARNNFDFDRQLMFYRRKLVSAKYNCIENISKITTIASQSLLQIITYLHQFIKNKQDFFTVKTSRSQQRSNVMRKPKPTDFISLPEFIMIQSKKYQDNLNAYQNIIVSLIEVFNHINSSLEDKKIQQKNLIEQMNQYYQYGQCQIGSLSATFNLYNSFLKQLSGLGDKLSYSLSSLRQLNKQVVTQVEITITLIKNKANSSSRMSPTNKNVLASYQSMGSISSHQQKMAHHKDYSWEERRSQNTDIIQSLYEQMKHSHIEAIVIGIFNDVKQLVINTKKLISESTKRRTKTNNSMSISYSQVGEQAQERRPFSSQLWLWREWRNDLDMQNIELLEIQKKMDSFQSFLIESEIEDKQLQRLQCMLVSKKIKGQLSLKSKSLLFESKQNMTLFVPFKLIENIDIQIKMISNCFLVETIHGNLSFQDETDGGVKKFYATAQRAIDAFAQENQQGQQFGGNLALGQEQLMFMKQRSSIIQKQLVNQDQYQNYRNLFVPDVSIRDVYRVIYSDQPVTIKGKEYQCFTDFMMNKNNNFNQKFTKFDNPGPEFYSNNHQITFKNCPLYSQRIVQHDHRINVPFLPQSCHNKMTVRLYWISNQEFHVLQLNDTTGAPYVADFTISVLTVVKQKGDDVEINMHMKATIIKEFALSGMIVEKGRNETKIGSQARANEIKKIMLGYKNKQSKVKAASQKDKADLSGDDSRIQRFQKMIEALQFKNKVLIWCLVGVFLLNVFLKIYF